MLQVVTHSSVKMEFVFHRSPTHSGKPFTTIVQNGTHLPLTPRMPFDSIRQVSRTQTEVNQWNFVFP
jgi:hypothetical protein